jgi:hypothetical protein
MRIMSAQVLAACVTLVCSGAPNPGTKTLKGLHEVDVAILLAKDIEATGLTESQLQVDVELRLRKAGISVVSADQLAHDAFGNPKFDTEAEGAEFKRRVARLGDVGYLTAHVDGIVTDEGTVFYAVKVALIQSVKISRSNIAAVVTTWEDQELGAVGKRKTQELRSAVMDLVDRFLNDYLSSNPRQ